MSTSSSLAPWSQGIARLGLGILMAAIAALAAGCGALAQPTEQPRPSQTIQGFMQQPRPGNGIIGP